jgi:hypothetical protein
MANNTWSKQHPHITMASVMLSQIDKMHFRLHCVCSDCAVFFRPLLFLQFSIYFHPDSWAKAEGVERSSRVSLCPIPAGCSRGKDCGEKTLYMYAQEWRGQIKLLLFAFEKRVEMIAFCALEIQLMHFEWLTSKGERGLMHKYLPIVVFLSQFSLQ